MGMCLTVSDVRAVGARNLGQSGSLWWVTTQKNGASALGLQRVLGLTKAVPDRQPDRLDLAAQIAERHDQARAGSTDGKKGRG